MFASNALHVVSPGLGVLNPMLYLKSSLLAIIDLLQMLLDACIVFWPALGFHVMLQVKLGPPPSALPGPLYRSTQTGSGRGHPRQNTFGCEFFLRREERVRLLVGSPGASMTPIYSPGSSSTPIYSPGFSTPPRYSPPQSYSPGTSRNAECSNCKHLLGKITVLEATVEMYMHPGEHTLNSVALLHEVYNDMKKLDLE
ncbi:hypothetical protein Tco_0122737 [Tanacetum coccineum]